MNKILVFLFLLFSGLSLSAQNEYDDEVPPSIDNEEFVGFNKKKNKEKKDLSRIRIGGTAGFGLSNNFIGFSFSPLVGYQVIEDRLELGSGIIYDLGRFKDPRNRRLEHLFGFNNYARVYVWEGLFVQGRLPIVKLFVNDNGLKLQSEWVWNAFAGAGYQIKLGEKAFFNIGLEVNIIPYQTNFASSTPSRVISPFFNFQFGL